MAAHPVHRAESQGFLFDRCRSPLRWPAALMLLISALAHIPVLAPEFAETVYVGVLFVVLIVADCVLLAALLIRDSAAVWTLTAITTGLAFVAYVLSRTVGLPALHGYIGDWISTPGLASIVAEAVGCALAVTVLARHPHLTSPR